MYYALARPSPAGGTSSWLLHPQLINNAITHTTNRWKFTCYECIPTRSITLGITRAYFFWFREPETFDAVGYGDCSERNELQNTSIALLEYSEKIRSKLWVNLKMVTIVNTQTAQIGFKPITMLIARANQWNLAVCTYSATNWVFNDFLSSKTVEEVVKLISRYFHGRKYVIRALRTMQLC